MATGTAKWFNAEKGFGFIEQGTAAAPTSSPTTRTSPPAGFRELLEGQKVSFDIAQGQKADGPRHHFRLIRPLTLE
ncbi:Cold shock protein ScoF [Streptomyces alboniger]